MPQSLRSKVTFLPGTAGPPVKRRVVHVLHRAVAAPAGVAELVGHEGHQASFLVVIRHAALDVVEEGIDADVHGLREERCPAVDVATAGAGTFGGVTLHVAVGLEAVLQAAADADARLGLEEVLEAGPVVGDKNPDPLDLVGGPPAVADLIDVGVGGGGEREGREGDGELHGVSPLFLRTRRLR
jgi:hypothetical protein